MEYISNGQYSVNLNGQEVIVSAEDLRDAFLDIKKYEGSEVNDYIETCPVSEVYADSARFELLRTEIKDDGWKDLKWSDELESAIDIAMECAMLEAKNYYKAFYLMEKKI